MRAEQRCAVYTLSVIKKIVVVSLVGIVMVLLALFIHELGHVLAALFLGVDILRVHFFNFTVYPNFGIQEMQGFLGQVYWEKPFNDIYSGIILLMGSLLTWIVSVFFIIILYVRKARGGYVEQTILLLGSLMFLDLVTYSFGLRLSGFNEPQVAANYLAIPWGTFLISMAILASIQLFFVVRYVYKREYFKLLIRAGQV